MISPKKIYNWMQKALEEPFFRAEMHKVEMLLRDSKKQDQLSDTAGKGKFETGHDLSRMETQPVRRGWKKVYYDKLKGKKKPVE